MTVHDPYPTAGGVESAIKDAAKKAATAEAALGVDKRIQLEHFNRFLSRVFSESAESEWILKGGTGILARVPSTRSTLDIDLYRKGFTLGQALDDLIRLAAIDLADHFRFEYAGHTDSIGGDTQPYTDGYRVKFNVLIGLSARMPLQVDLAVGAAMTGDVLTRVPANALHLPRLASYPYRLYPVVDQIADKVCATMADYQDRASSREKDLVDLVVIATTHELDGTGLHGAITTEASRRKTEPFAQFAVPSKWGAGYGKVSKPVPYCAAYPTVDLAAELVTRLVNPALSGAADGMTWSPGSLHWTLSDSRS